MGASVDKIEYKDIVFHENIGEGGFGTVHRVTFKKTFKGCREAAAKTVTINAKDEQSEHEVKIMAELKHPNIVTFLGVCETHVKIIILEFAKYGSLRKYLKNESEPLSLELKRKWIKESAIAIEYLHAHNVLHRDIKASNCLIFENNTLKLCDFGLAREIDSSRMTASLQGTWPYLAPELIIGNERHRPEYSKPADIYAFGMLILEICTRKPPFVELEWQTLSYRVGNGEQPDIPEDCPEDLVGVMKRCWKFNPADRPSIDEVRRALFQWTLVRTIQPRHRRTPLKAYRIACCPNGDMVVTDKLYILDRDGKFKKGLNKTAEWETDITVAGQSQVLTTYGTNVVKVFDKDLKHLDSFCTTTKEESLRADSQLVCAAMDRDEHVLVYDRKRGMISIHKYPHGNLLYRFEVKCNIDPQHNPSMVVNSKDVILLHFLPSGSVHSKVIAMDYFGNEVFSFTPRINDDVTDKMALPCGIVCDVYDIIYIAVRVKSLENSGHIQRYSSTGAFLGCIVEGLLRPCDLSITSDKSDQSLVVANFHSILTYALR